jgi:beta-hydroxyacyl-ACP dehydratase FabZ
VRDAGSPPAMDVKQVLRLLPHRYPMVLVDRVLEIEGDQRAVGIKNVTMNEPFFQGHVPGHPIMPGVLIVEAMAQVGGVLLMGTVDDPESKVVYFMSLDNVKFRKPVRPGDQIRIEVDIIQLRNTVCRIKGVAKVDDAVVCEAEMAAVVRDRRARASIRPPSFTPRRRSPTTWRSGRGHSSARIAPSGQGA